MSEVDYSFLDDYFEEILSDPNFRKLHPDHELLDEEYDHIWEEEIANAVEQGFGISTFEYVKKFLKDCIESDDYEAVAKISEQLVKGAEYAEEYNPSDIGYWEFIANGCELEPITRKGIYRRFLDYWEEREGEE